MSDKNNKYNINQILISSYKNIKRTEGSLVVLWDSNQEDKDILHLYDYIEENSDRLRAKYLKFISEFNYSKVGSKRLSDYFELDKGYNLLWMSLISEKSPFKSPRIFDCLKILAIEEIIIANNPKSIKYIGSSYRHQRTIKALSKNMNLEYSWSFHLPRITELKFPFVKSIYRSSPQMFQAIVSIIKYSFVRNPFFKNKSREWKENSSSVFFFSYFIALDEKKLNSGDFYSHQWGPLPEIIHNMGVETSWIHHFIFSNQTPDPQIAINYLKGFNKDPKTNGIHNILDNYLSYEIIIRVFKNYFTLIFRSLTFPFDQKIFSPKGTLVNFWFFLNKDWYSSVRGITAIQNLLWIELIDAAMRDIPKQKIGFFLQENQGWEMALIHGWRVNNHGTIIGVAHSTVRYWDLRYYNLTPELSKTNIKPEPDFTAINGPAALNNFEAVQGAVGNLINVEALRYLYLNNKIIINTQKSTRKTYKIIVLGDIQKDLTRSMIKCLNEIVLSFKDYEFIFKPHPANIIEEKYFIDFQPTRTDDHLNILFNDADLVVTSAATSSGLEAYIYGIPVITFFDSKELNLSALRGIDKAVFVNNSDSLYEAILMSVSAKPIDSVQDIFWLNEDLSGWRKLLSDFKYYNATQ